jgi:hypothetical protein
MPVTPETLNYLILGLVAIAVIMGLLIGSFVIRQRNLEQDLRLIQELSDETK